MTEEQIRDRIRSMIEVDRSGDVDFVDRLEIVSQETVECGCCTPSTRVVVALDLIDETGA